MRDCCKDTYKKTLEDVLHFLDRMRGHSIDHILMMLEYAIKVLTTKEKTNEHNPK